MRSCAVTTYSKEEVANVVRDVDSQAHVGEVEAVAEADERQTDKVVAHKLLEVLPGRFHAEDEYDGLLRPVGGLKKVVEFEAVFVGLVWEPLVHSRGIKIPHWCLAHNVHAPWAAESEIDGGVHLFHEAGLFALGLDTSVTGQGLQQLLHDELAGEGQDDDVEGHEGDIPGPLAILCWCSIGSALGERQLVAEKYKVVDGVRFVGVQCVEAAEDGQEEGRQCPGVFDGVVGCLLRQTACFASFGLAFRGGRVFSVDSLYILGKHGQRSGPARAARSRGGGPAHTLPLAAFRWAKEVDKAGAPVSPLVSAAMPLDFLLRRAALPLASWEVEYWSWALRRGNGSEAAMLGSAHSTAARTWLEDHRKGGRWRVEERIAADGMKVVTRWDCLLTFEVGRKKWTKKTRVLASNK